MVKKFKDMFINFDRIHEHGRRTDGRTPHDGIASRGNKLHDEQLKQKLQNTYTVICIL